MGCFISMFLTFTYICSSCFHETAMLIEFSEFLYQKVYFLFWCFLSFLFRVKPNAMSTSVGMGKLHLIFKHFAAFTAFYCSSFSLCFKSLPLWVNFFEWKVGKLRYCFFLHFLHYFSIVQNSLILPNVFERLSLAALFAPKTWLKQVK